jgi:hypothetical protein
MKKTIFFGMKPPIRICSYAMFAAIFALSAACGQSPAPLSAGSPNLQELQKQLQQCKQENQRLRELLTQGNTAHRRREQSQSRQAVPRLD